MVNTTKMWSKHLVVKRRSKMHYCLVLVTKDLPTDEHIGKVLEKFDNKKLYEEVSDGVTLFDTLTTEEKKLRYPFSYDYWQVGGRYGGYIKYKLQEDDYKFYNHNINMKKVRSKLYDKLQENYKDRIAMVFGYEVDECDFVNYLGLHDKFLYCDGAKISQIQNIEEIKNDFGCYIYDAVNDIAYAREYWVGGEEGWQKNEDYQRQMREIIENNADGFLTIIDLHD